MSTLAAIGERAATGRDNGTSLPLAGKNNQPPTKRSNRSKKSTKTGSPEALALLKAHPGLDGSPLGSPSALAAAKAAGKDSADTDPATANCFHGLKLLPEPSQSPGSLEVGGGGGGEGSGACGRGSSRRVVSPRARGGRSPAARAGAAPAAAGGNKAVGGGKKMLARTGRDLVIAGELRGIGTGGEGAGGGGEGPLSARLLGT